MNLIDFSAKVLEDVRDGMPADLPLVVRIQTDSGGYKDFYVTGAELTYPIDQYTLTVGDER